MATLNKVFLMGNLTRDPELRYTPDGTPVCSFGLAVNRFYTTAGGEKKQDAIFVDITVWRKQAENCAEYLKKGRPVMVEGRLEMDTWEGKDGQKRSKLRVVAVNVQFMGARPTGEETPAALGGATREKMTPTDLSSALGGSGGGKTDSADEAHGHAPEEQEEDIPF
ncbi:MAG: single-stranded DNA-binding protein [Planctomycetota bacterium]